MTYQQAVDVYEPQWARVQRAIQLGELDPAALADPFLGSEGRSWVAQPKQALMLWTYGDVDDVYYGGAAGGGKTDALIVYQGIRRSTYPGSVGMILRRRMVDMTRANAIIPRFLKMYGAEGRWDSDLYKFYWHNGSITEFAYCNDEGTLETFLGGQWDDISFDEATLLPGEWHSAIAARARVTNPQLAAIGMKSQIRSTGNPGGEGHGYFLETYVENGDCTVVEVDLGEGETMTRVFVQAKLTDNQALLNSDPKYKAQLLAIKDPVQRARMVDGDWWIFPGQYFSTFREAVHVIDPVVPPKHWRRFIGHDWGWRSPFVILYAAQDPDTGQLVVYNEVDGTETTSTQIATLMEVHAAGERIYAAYCDRSIWNKRADGRSTAEDYQRTLGFTIKLVPANNDRVTGWTKVREALAYELDRDGTLLESPQLLITSNCRNLIKTLQQLQYDDIDTEDLDTKGPDHWADALRYLLMGVGVRLVVRARLKTRYNYRGPQKVKAARQERGLPKWAA